MTAWLDWVIWLTQSDGRHVGTPGHVIVKLHQSVSSLTQPYSLIEGQMSDWLMGICSEIWTSQNVSFYQLTDGMIQLDTTMNQILPCRPIDWPTLWCWPECTIDSTEDRIGEYLRAAHQSIANVHLAADSTNVSRTWTSHWVQVIVWSDCSSLNAVAPAWLCFGQQFNTIQTDDLYDVLFIRIECHQIYNEKHSCPIVCNAEWKFQLPSVLCV